MKCFNQNHTKVAFLILLAYTLYVLISRFIDVSLFEKEENLGVVLVHYLPNGRTDDNQTHDVGAADITSEDHESKNQSLVVLEKHERQNSSSQTNMSSTTSNSHPHLLHSVPDDPDSSIGDWLRSIIVTKQNNNITTSNMTESESEAVMDGDSDSSSPLSKCSPTSQMQIYTQGYPEAHTESESMSVSQQDGIIHMNYTNSNFTWILKTLDEEGNEKSIGGDEFFISYRDQIAVGMSDTAVAMITDNLDGTYKLDFVGPPYGAKPPISNITGVGTLKISLLFTCGIGRMTRPTKDDWKTGGHLYHDRYTYTISNASAPYIRHLRHPNISPVDGTKIIDFSKHHKVFCFGDSLMQNFCGKFYSSYRFRQDNLFASPNVGSKVRRDTLDIALDTLDELWGTELNSNHNHTMNVSILGEDLDSESSDHSTANATALILDSAAWELGSNLGPIEDHYFNDTIQMYYDYVKAIRARYPHVKLYWKSPQAVHPTMLKDGCYRSKRCFGRVRYVSLASMEYLYVQQKRIMKELGVTFLDIWEASYVAHAWHMDGDAFHYRHCLLDLFYPDSMANNV